MSADLPDWTTQGEASWKFSLPISKTDADRLAAGVPELDALEPAPVFVTDEPDPNAPDAWRLDVYFEGEPPEAMLSQIRAFVGQEGGTLERLDDADWVTISQGWLAPIRAGRFYIHTAAHADDLPVDAIPFRIEASRAFGTGHHETTAGCLDVLSALADEGMSFARVADIGTGTGLLAFASHALWPDAAIVATDIDPVAIPVIEENMAANGIPMDAIALGVADGIDHPALRGGTFDLVIANILAGPLIELAPDFARIGHIGSRLILAGLLSSQEADVLAAFVAHGYAFDRRLQRGDWPVLVLAKTA
jgi:ribosomal protein L11 methyltransferase